MKELQQQQQTWEEPEQHNSKGVKGEGRKGGKGGKGGKQKENNSKAASHAANGSAAKVGVWGDADHVRHATSASLLSTLAGATEELMEVVESEIDRHASKNLHLMPIAKLPAVSGIRTSLL